MKTATTTSTHSESNAELIQRSLQIATPSWPLQNSVAVNPFWFLRDRPFEDVLGSLEAVTHTALYLPVRHYLQRFSTGEIDEQCLKAALDQAIESGWEMPTGIPEFLAASRDLEAVAPHLRSYAEWISTKQDWSVIVATELGRHAAAYFDDHQALAPYPWQDCDFWQAWHKAQRHDRSMEMHGAGGFRTVVRELEGLQPEPAIQHMLEQMGFGDGRARGLYLQRLTATCLGWASQFQYSVWQEGLGGSPVRSARPHELLAVRLAYDFGLFRALTSTPEKIAAWLKTFRPSEASESTVKKLNAIRNVWQSAAERTYQKHVAAAFHTTTTATPGDANWQLAFCIDVRSELIRRHLEGLGPHIQTIGFAGFFGLPVEYRRLDEAKPGRRLPVLLAPAIRLHECPKGKERTGTGRSDMAWVQSFFRNMRKAPLASFLFVELFGLLSIENLLRRTWLSIQRVLRGRSLPERFQDADSGPDGAELVSGAALSPGDLADRAMGILKHMGLTNFGRVVFLVGHGSVTTNNAFGSALDCGACGGHAGDVNVRFLAGILNRRDVRLELERRGLTIPEQTCFVAAVHETVTDEIYILDEDGLPASMQGELSSARNSFRQASQAARQERMTLRSQALDRHIERRARNWSEVRPEWGLAGNACFIVAPRHRTRGLNLAGRAFLHDYDWSSDRDFATLELIMTAPMVVTNWINLQYYASTVAPSVYGSGNKVLHNLTDEVGVVEGNGGDLRIGLPWQSVHDGERRAHEPLRLSVFIEAPRTEMERIIEKHAVVRELVQNGWLHILHIDSAGAGVMLRQPNGQYVPL
ncbi:MAG: DUF2309 domain-containing protein [Spirochaetales bacterium]|nr:DUF2309 domain-containing protein [Spirochaetales bacterium]